MKKFNWKLYLIFAGILLLALFSFGFGNDYYWHVKAGEYIVRNLKIPYHDIFSWYGISKNLYWMSHEWLSEVVLYIYKYLFKGLGPILFNLSMYLLLITVLFKHNKESLEKNKIFTFGWAIVGFLIFSKVMLPRPHMISYTLLAFTVYILYDNFHNKNSKKIYFLPLISMLWANFHGGSSNLPYILCFIFLLCGLLSFKFQKIEAKKIGKNQIKKYLICGILSICAIAINPHGLKMITYPYINMGDKLMLENIMEWAGPNLNDFGDIAAFAVIGMVVITMILSKKKISFIDFAVLGSFLFLGFKSVRFVPLLYIASTYVIFNMVQEFEIKVPNVNFLVILSAIIICYGILTPKLIRNYNKRPISSDAIQYIKDSEPKRLFNYYDYGGYLIYNDIKVFIDGRADMYSKYNFKDAVDLQDRGYDYLINGYDFDMFIIPHNIALNIHLSNNDKYTVVYQNDNTVIYEKKTK
mgnify:FL=1